MSDSETTRTGIYLGVAGVLAALTILPLGGAPPATMGQQGKRFFPEFDDFTKAVVLEVVDYENGEAQPFKVEFKDGLWRIPSRYNYPADAKDKIGKVAAAVMTLERTVLRSTKLEDQAKFGVVDPLDGEKGPEGRGRRITLRDGDENVLASLIVSEKKEQKEGEEDPLGLPAGHRFVRAADETEIYSAKIDLELSTDFEKWIDTDVLDLAVADIATLTIARYKVDESQLPGIVIKGEETSVLRQQGTDWKVEGMRPDQQAAIAAVDSLTEGLRELKIVDVRPFQRDLRAMVSVGIFPTQEKIYGNEGELQVETKDGLIYVLYFGEEAPGSKAKEPRRFLYIRAGLNGKVLEGLKDAAKRKEVQQKANLLAKRFQGWYYVISAKSFKDLRPPPAALVEPKKDDDEHGEGGHGHGAAKTPQDPFEAMGFPPLLPEGTAPVEPADGKVGEDGPPAPPGSEKQPPEQPEQPPEQPKQPEDDKLPGEDKPKQPTDEPKPPPVPGDAKKPEQPPEQPKDGPADQPGKPGDAPPNDGE